MRLLKIVFALAFPFLLLAQEPIPPKEPKQRQQKQQRQRKETQDADPRVAERRQREQSEKMTNVYADTATHRYYRSRCNGSPGLMMMSLWEAKRQRFSSASCKDR